MKSILQGWPQSNGGRKKQLYLLSCGSVFFIMFSLIFCLGYIFWNKQPPWGWSAAESRLSAWCWLSEGCQLWHCNLLSRAAGCSEGRSRVFLRVKVLAQIFDWTTVSILPKNQPNQQDTARVSSDPSILRSWWPGQVYPLSKWHIRIILGNYL